MPRLSIDISPDEHRRLKAIAALKGQSVKDYVLECTLDDAPRLDAMGPNEAVAALSDFLDTRIGQVRRGDFSTRSMAEIRESARKRSKQ